MVRLVPNAQTLAGHDVGAIRLAPTTTLHFNQPLKKNIYEYLVFSTVSKWRVSVGANGMPS